MAFNYEFPYTDPNLYNDDWLLNSIKGLKASIDELDAWKEEHTAEYEELKTLYDEIMSGDFPESVVIAFNNWARVNMPSLVADMVKAVFFGLNDSGYFVAYVPDSWADIIFNTTGLDITIPGVDYGHLVLSFNA